DSALSYVCVVMTATSSCNPLLLVVFFSPTRRHPRSTLFPYTTLFRSANERVRARDGTLARASLVSDRRLHVLDARHRERGAVGQDRKSTRLNSSHVASSYAVFCLKKKKVEPRQLDRQHGRQRGRAHLP